MATVPSMGWSVVQGEGRSEPFPGDRTLARVRSTSSEATNSLPPVDGGTEGGSITSTGLPFLNPKFSFYLTTYISRLDEGEADESASVNT